HQLSEYCSDVHARTAARACAGIGRDGFSTMTSAGRTGHARNGAAARKRGYQNSMRFSKIMAFTMAGAAFTALAQPARPQAADTLSISVAADRNGPTINRHIFGQFAEHLGSGIYGGIWVGKE